MKYKPLQGKPCTLYEIHTPYGDNPVHYMTYIPLQGHPSKLYEIHTLTGTTL